MWERHPTDGVISMSIITTCPLFSWRHLLGVRQTWSNRFHLKYLNISSYSATWDTPPSKGAPHNQWNLHHRGCGFDGSVFPPHGQKFLVGAWDSQKAVCVFVAVCVCVYMCVCLCECVYVWVCFCECVFLWVCVCLCDRVTTVPIPLCIKPWLFLMTEALR